MSQKLFYILLVLSLLQHTYGQSRANLARGVGVQRRVHYDGFNTSSETNSWYQRVAAPGPRGRCTLDSKMCANNAMCCSGLCVRGKCTSRRLLQDLQDQEEEAINTTSLFASPINTNTSFSNAGDVQLRNVFNDALSAILSSFKNSSEFEHIPQKSNFTRDEIEGTLERVVESGLLRVGVPAMPIGVRLSNATAPDQFRLDGYFVDLVNFVTVLMSKKMEAFINATFLILPNSDGYHWQSTLTDYLYSDLVDVGLFVHVTNETKNVLALSQTIYDDKVVAILTRNSTQEVISMYNSTQEVISMHNTTQDGIGILGFVPFYDLIAEAKPDNELIEYNSIISLRDGFKNREVNSMACMGSMVGWYNDSGCDGKCSVEYIPLDEAQSFAFAFRQYPLSIPLQRAIE